MQQDIGSSTNTYQVSSENLPPKNNANNIPHNNSTPKILNKVLIIIIIVGILGFLITILIRNSLLSTTPISLIPGKSSSALYSTIEWHYQIGPDAIKNTLTIKDKVYIVIYDYDSETSSIQALSQSDKKQLWKSKIDGYFQSIITDGTDIFVEYGSNGDIIAKINSQTGDKIWIKDIPGGIASTMILDESSRSILYVDHSGNLHSIDISTQEIKLNINLPGWKNSGTAGAGTPIAMYNNNLYYEGLDGLTSFNILSSNKNWSGIHTTGKWILSGNILFIGTYDQMQALDNQTGREIWHQKTSRLTFPRMIYKNLIIFGYDKIYAVDQQSGKIVWTYDTKQFTTSEILLINDILYFSGHYYGLGPSNGRIYALNAENGKELLNKQVDKAYIGEPILGQGRIFASGRFGLYSLK